MLSLLPKPLTMISLQHQPSMEPTLFSQTRPKRRRRFHETSTMYQLPSKKRRLEVKKTSILDLPVEILGNILSLLPQVDLVRSSRTCRAWHESATDPLLWKDIDLTGASRLNSLCGDETFPEILDSKISQCRSFHTQKQPIVYPETLCQILTRLANSQSLTSIAISVNFTRGILPFLTFFKTCAGNLTHIDLSRSQVPNCLVSAILERQGKTLVSLNLEFSAITEVSLQLITREATALKHLGIAGCLAISSRGLEHFLKRGVPETVTSLDLRWLMDTEASWLQSLLHRRNRIRRLEIDGCDKITSKAVEALTQRFPPVAIKCKARPVWTYRLHSQKMGL